MKILIVSDTHRKDDNLKKVIEKTSPLDMLIHLGDAEGSETKIAGWVGEDCVTILNPGSLSYPRQDGRKPSFMIMELDDQGKAHFTLNFLEPQYN